MVASFTTIALEDLKPAPVIFFFFSSIMKDLTLFCYPFFIRFDAIVSADAFENLKPAPDIFLAASNILNVPPSEVY